MRDFPVTGELMTELDYWAANNGAPVFKRSIEKINQLTTRNEMLEDALYTLAAKAEGGTEIEDLILFARAAAAKEEV